MDDGWGAGKPNWYKSTYSANQGECVEVAENLGDPVLVRDTKDRTHSVVLRVPRSAWISFLAGVSAGEFDQHQ